MDFDWVHDQRVPRSQDAAGVCEPSRHGTHFPAQNDGFIGKLSLD